MYWPKGLFLLGVSFFMPALVAQSDGLVTRIGLDMWNWRKVNTPVPVNSIRVDDEFDQVWYATSAAGFLVSTNRGSTWAVTLPEPIQREAFAIDTLSRSRMLAGSGRRLFESRNRGINWTQISTLPAEISSIMWSRDGSIYLGVRGSPDFSGIYRSGNGGASWQEVPFGATIPKIVSVLDIEQDSSSTIYVSTEAQFPEPKKFTLLRSANQGVSWQDAGGAWTRPPNKLYWEGIYTRALYGANDFDGLLATQNQGSLWVVYSRSASSAVAMGVQGTFLVFAGMAGSFGGGVGVTGAQVPIQPNHFPGALSSTGLNGVSVADLTANLSRTMLYAAADGGGIYAGTIMDFKIDTTTIYAAVGGTLELDCPYCFYQMSSLLRLGGRDYEFRAPIGTSQQLILPRTIAAGTYQAQLRVGDNHAFPVTVTIGETAPVLSRMTSVRFVSKNQYAPGEIATLFGSRLTGLINGSSSTVNASQGLPWEDQLVRTQVLVDGRPASLHFAFTNMTGSSQINFQIPGSLIDGTHTLRVNRLRSDGSVEAQSAELNFAVRRVSPTYLGSDLLPIFLQNVTSGPAGNVYVTPDTPARPNDVLVAYATGFGPTTPAVADGMGAGNELAHVQTPATILVRGMEELRAEVLGAVASPQFPGLYQIAFRIPEASVEKPNGLVDLVIGVGGDVQTFSINFVH